MSELQQVDGVQCSPDLPANERGVDIGVIQGGSQHGILQSRGTKASRHYPPDKIMPGHSLLPAPRAQPRAWPVESRKQAVRGTAENRLLMQTYELSLLPLNLNTRETGQDMHSRKIWRYAPRPSTLPAAPSRACGHTGLKKPSFSQMLRCRYLRCSSTFVGLLLLAVNQATRSVCTPTSGNRMNILEGILGVKTPGCRDSPWQTTSRGGDNTCEHCSGGASVKCE